MTKKSGNGLSLFSFHFKFGWRFCEAETPGPLKIFRFTIELSIAIAEFLIP